MHNQTHFVLCTLDNSGHLLVNVVSENKGSKLYFLHLSDLHLPRKMHVSLNLEIVYHTSLLNVHFLFVLFILLIYVVCQ